MKIADHNKREILFILFLSYYKQDGDRDIESCMAAVCAKNPSTSNFI